MELENKIKAHHSFGALGSVKQEMILCPAYIKWLERFFQCMVINRDRALTGLKNHTNICPEFKIIYSDIVNEAQ